MSAPSPESLRRILPSVRPLARSLGRTLLLAAALLVAYGLVPLEPSQYAFGAYVVLFLGLVAFIALFARLLMKVYRSDSPLLQGVEALVLTATFFVVVFSAGYSVLSASVAESFTQPVDKVDAVYFTVTVLATVGFGDIAAVTTPARIMVTIQMVLDLILVGAAVRLLTSTAKAAAARRAKSQDASASE